MILAITALCLILFLAFTDADPIYEWIDGIFFYAENDITDEDGKSNELESKESCTIYRCVDSCTTSGFGPLFTAQCINSTANQCIQQ